MKTSNPNQLTELTPGHAGTSEKPRKTKKPRSRWHLVTNQLNLMYLLAAGLLPGPRGFGNKYYRDALALAPGWIPLFANAIPPEVLTQAVSEDSHLLAVIAELDLSPLRGPVMAMDAQGELRQVDYPDGLNGHETALFVPAPLPAVWIKTLWFASSTDKTATLEQAGDFDNVTLPAKMAKVKATLFKPKTLPWPPSSDGLGHHFGQPGDAGILTATYRRPVIQSRQGQDGDYPGRNDDQGPSDQAASLLLPARDPALHRVWGIGATLALLTAIANRGDSSVEACRLAFDPNAVNPAAFNPAAFNPAAFDSESPTLSPPALLPALYRWVTQSPATAADGLQAGMLLATLEAIIDEKQRADDEDRRPDTRQAVLDYLRAEKARLDDQRLRAALDKLDQDLRGIVGFGADTGGELLERHAKPYSRALILFFLRDDWRGFLEFDHPLLNEMDRIVAAMLFGAATGWRSLPDELRQSTGPDAVSLRMAAAAQRAGDSGIDLGPSPPRRRPLRELLTPSAKGWNRKQQQTALALAQGLDWSDIIHTRISLGKGEYQLLIDGAGAHILLDGEVRAVTTHVDSEELLQRLTTAKVPAKLDARLRDLTR